MRIDAQTLGLPLGLTGATAATRFVGGTVSGPPVSGTFAVGDQVNSQAGGSYICTVAGTPGTWVDVATVGPSVSSVFTRSGAVTAQTGDYTAAQVGALAATAAASGDLSGNFPSPTVAKVNGTTISAAAAATVGVTGALPLNVYRPVAGMSGAARCQATTVTGAAVYLLSSNQVTAATAANTALSMISLKAANYAVAGFTTYLRLTASCYVNDAAPTVSFVTGLYPIGTPSGGGSVENPNYGTVVTGSTVTITTPAANSVVAESSTADFALPADGHYGLGVSVSGAMAANSGIILMFRLEVRNV